MSKTQKPLDEQLERQEFDLFAAIAAIDRKDYDYYDNLSEEQKSKIPWKILAQWISAVQGNSALQQYYVMSANSFANKYLFHDMMRKNPKLQWLAFCTAGLGQGKQFHKWIPQLREKIADFREKATNKEVKEFYKKIYPKIDNATLDELSSLYTLQQNKKVYLSNKFPSMKIEDIEILAEYVTQQDIDQYEREFGNL
jgi:hypothetical protein